MYRILCYSLVVFLTGCSSPSERRPLTVAHIENKQASPDVYPNLEALPPWVLAGLTQDVSDVAVYCTYPDSVTVGVLLKAKNNAEVLAKASLVKKIGSSEVVYSKEVLNGEAYSVEVKSRSSGYLPSTQILNSQVFKFKNRLHSCVAIGFADVF